jgi:hypothetical protein
VHATREDLDAHLDELRALPTDTGTLELIVRRPKEGERETPDHAEVTIEDGLVGDRWEPYVEEDGSLGREAQLTIASTQLLGLIAEPERWALAGDNLLVDMGLDMESLPAGSRLAIGETLVVQISQLPHTGCAKFSARFGSDALKFINSPEGRRLRLRGVNAKVVVPGTISVGDQIRHVRL